MMTLSIFFSTKKPSEKEHLHNREVDNLIRSSEQRIKIVSPFLSISLIEGGGQYSTLQAIESYMRAICHA